MLEGVIGKVLVARKLHECEWCKSTISIGTEYSREVIPPWRTGVDADADDEGRLIGSFYKAVPKWLVSKMHIDCRRKYYYEIGD